MLTTSSSIHRRMTIDRSIATLVGVGLVALGSVGLEHRHKPIHWHAC